MLMFESFALRNKALIFSTSAEINLAFINTAKLKIYFRIYPSRSAGKNIGLIGIYTILQCDLGYLVNFGSDMTQL